jgi:hypothetical protein
MMFQAGPGLAVADALTFYICTCRVSWYGSQSCGSAGAATRVFVTRSDSIETG